MKEITRRNFLRMATIAVLISGMGMLSSCGKSKEELMSGDWYLQGDDRLSLSLYDDGTCQIQGDYGQGKWSIVDEDTLKLTDSMEKQEPILLQLSMIIRLNLSCPMVKLSHIIIRLKKR